MDLEKRLREKIRSQGKATSTADAYWYWIDRYLKYCSEKGIGRETKAEVAVERFLSMLANPGHRKPPEEPAKPFTLRVVG